MSVTVNEFRTRFPEFADDSGYSNARIQLFIDDAADDLGSNETRWCGKYNKAQAYLAAHLLTVADKTELGDSSSNSGPISSKSAGGVSVTKSVFTRDRSEQEDWYMSSSYGQQFLIIRNVCFIGVQAANCL